MMMVMPNTSLTPNRKKVMARAVLGLLVMAGLLTVMFVFTPVGLGPAGITVWFFGLLAGSSLLLSVGLVAIKHWLRPTDEFPPLWKAAKRQALLISGWFTILIALSSLRQLGMRDAVLLTVLIVLIEIYARLR